MSDVLYVSAPQTTGKIFFWNDHAATLTEARSSSNSRKWICFETALSKDITGFDDKVVFVGDFELNLAWNNDKKEIGSVTFEEDVLVGSVF